MPTLVAGVIAVIILYTLLQWFRAANPAVLASALKIAGGIVCLAVAAFTGMKGEIFAAVPLGLFGAGLLGWAPAGAALGGWAGLGGRIWRGASSGGGSSNVRSAFLDMTLDHNSGALAGKIIAGTYAGRSLDEFDLPQLAVLMPTFDAESSALLESYLDRRFTGWRENTQGAGAGRQQRQASSSKMTTQEAYQILGVQPGAGADEIRRAHRSLMKKLHPDQGGSTYLAARVNEAKETLLRTHRN
jgi:hypothetical protein